MPAAVGSAEQPRFSAEGDTAKATLGRIVRHAYASVIGEQRESRPTLENVIDRLSQIVPLREFDQLLMQIALENLDQRSAQLPPNRQAFRALLPLMERSISNSASMRRTTSMAIGESGISVFPAALRRAFSSRSAMAKKALACGWVGDAVTQKPIETSVMMMYSIIKKLLSLFRT
jgi:hypothetical protein